MTRIESNDALAESQILELCEERINYTFRDKVLLKTALTHASFASHRLKSNERLEFLGDSILGFIVCEHLFEIYPRSFEGDLTKIKSVVVSRNTCARVSLKLGFEELLFVGKGMQTGGIPSSALADAFESIIAAVYLDGGIDEARRLIEDKIFPEIKAAVAGDLEVNHKSSLQQLAQKHFSCSPSYSLMEERGPDHKKNFLVSPQIGTRKFSAAWGNNKKEAEQLAAENALAELRSEKPPNDSDFLEIKE